MWGVPPQGSLTSQIPTKLYTSHKSTNFVTPPYARPYLSSRAKGQFFVPQWPDRPGSGQAHACLMHPSGELQNCGREGPAAGGSGRRAPCGGAPYKKDPLALKAARGSRTIFGSGLLSHMTLCSIIGDGELNFRVRNGVGCTLSSMATKEICQNIETGMEGFFEKQDARAISTGQLHPSQGFHLQPIDEVVYLGPSGLASGRTYLKAGFPLRCFQRLSLPHIATLLCRWHDNRSTSGVSIPVLSY